MNAAVTHELKTWPEFFEAIVTGAKTFEIRKNDRDFKVGDVLWLREFTVGMGLSGRDARFRVSYMTAWRQQPGYVVLGLERSAAPARETPKYTVEFKESALMGCWWVVCHGGRFGPWLERAGAEQAAAELNNASQPTEATP